MGVKKLSDETAALERLSGELAFCPDLVTHLRDYQTRANDEARFVWACDKIQSYVQGQLDDWRPHRELPVTKKCLLRNSLSSKQGFQQFLLTSSHVYRKSGSHHTQTRRINFGSRSELIDYRALVQNNSSS